MDVRVEGQVVDAPEQGDVAAVLQKALSGKKFKSVVAARVTAEGTETLCDLSATVPAQCTDITPVYADSPEGLSMIRHSTAHVMAAAVKKLYPSAKVTIGPAVENGFYYDFDVEKPFSSEDFPAIEAEMQRIVNERLPFVRTTMSKADAIEKFSKMGENFKVEIIEGIEGDTVSLYTCGDFTDLCRGPHVPHTGFSKASKILSAAGAYWRGDEKNPMLSRLYGTAFADEKALNAYLKQLEEAKRRDHRKLGRELGFFTFHEDVAPGMVFWLPKGMLMRTILEDFWRREHIKRNYDLVQGPQLLRVETWQRSGHYDHYRQNMYFTQIEDDQYGIKPMNCISHMLIYRNDLRSYRDLPQRYFELGVVHRHEKSGTLHGLLRVRQFTQDDAHILCTPEQLEGEILGVIHLIRDLMHLFGFDYKVGISTRPKDSIGTDEAWELATNALIEAVKKADMPYEINEGDGAFYGPKIDVRLLDCIGREWQCSTIQVDFTLPERFDLTYKGSDDKEHRPIMIHRAPFGSMERFVAVLLEHTGGKFPLWLSPQQVVVLPISEKFNDYAQKVSEFLNRSDVRTEVDDRNEKIGRKIRDNELKRIPYLLIVGEKEEAEGLVSVRAQGEGDKGQMSLEAFRDFIAGLVKEEIEANKLEKK